MRLVTGGPAETMGAGRMFGERLASGDTVLLYGDLGSGKTTFVKGIALAMGIPEREISSASFTIIAEHRPAEGAALYHIDLYRLESEEDIEAAGIYECVGGDGVAVIEWAERLSGVEIGGAIKVRINILSGKKREILIEGLRD